MTTLLQCPNCFAPLPPPGSGHAVCRFCGATSLVQRAAHAAPPAPLRADPNGASALALDFRAQHGVDLTSDAQAMDRLGVAWTKALVELQSTARTRVNLPFLTATKDGPLHYERELDANVVATLLRRVR